MTTTSDQGPDDGHLAWRAAIAKGDYVRIAETMWDGTKWNNKELPGKICAVEQVDKDNTVWLRGFGGFSRGSLVPTFPPRVGDLATRRGSNEPLRKVHSSSRSPCAVLLDGSAAWASDDDIDLYPHDTVDAVVSHAVGLDDVKLGARFLARVPTELPPGVSSPGDWFQACKKLNGKVVTISCHTTFAHRDGPHVSVKESNLLIPMAWLEHAPKIAMSELETSCAICGRALDPKCL